MEFKEYEDSIGRFDKYEEKDKLSCYVFGICGESGEIAEKIKKIYRDKKGKISQSDREGLAKEIGDVLWYITRLATWLKIPMDNCASMNLGKLTEREARDMIHGDGDDR